MIIALSGCGGADNPVQNVPSVMPAAVQQIVDAPFAADGQVHVQSRGRFRVKPETMFCAFDSHVDAEMKAAGIAGVGLIGIDQMLRDIGQLGYLNGSSRVRTVNAKHCSDDGQNVVYRGYAIANRKGKPYKLVQAVWQKDAIWVGQIERIAGKSDSNIFNPYGTDPIEFEVMSDIKTLSSSFIRHLMGDN